MFGLPINEMYLVDVRLLKRNGIIRKLRSIRDIVLVVQLHPRTRSIQKHLRGYDVSRTLGYRDVGRLVTDYVHDENA